jgi:ATP-dependent Clp protease ATP-binding subunit ClpB
LQVLDDGRLTDGQGRTVDFRNTVIIMTSNIGSQTIQRLTKDSEYKEMKENVIAELAEHFKPEFINRVDESIVFHPLVTEQIIKIAAIQINQLAKRLAEKEIVFNASKEALTLVASVGFDPLFGARPLKRSIQKNIENPLAQHILSADFKAGDSICLVVENNQLVFKKIPQ